MKTIYLALCMLLLVACQKENSSTDDTWSAELNISQTMCMYKNGELIGEFDNDMVDLIYLNKQRCIFVYNGRSIIYFVEDLQSVNRMTRVYLKSNQLKYIEYNTDVLNYVYESESNVIKLTFKMQKHEKL
ncbi:hypothetical protein BF503P1_00048 [Bacteroides phage BF503P1]|nr:hypothetical protein BF503P1_00048 [Bacteroides phage BF503P1]